MASIVATSYPLLDVFFTTLWIVGFVLWIWLVIAIFTDLFRDHEMSGWAKAAWIIFVIVLPVIGVLVYLIARGGKMREHAMQAAQDQEEATQQYIRSVATNGTNTAEELSRLAALRDQGVLSQQEFDQQKARILSSSS
jgi:ABC-type multidrug transport system fused ATPase/permease subunit